METMYFILGILTMVALAFVGVLVVGLIKINKQERKIKDFEESVRFDREQFQRQFENIYRSQDDQNRSFWDHMRNAETGLEKQFETIKKESNSYTDSRIDKLIDTYFEVKNLNKNNKELIKG